MNQDRLKTLFSEIIHIQSQFNHMLDEIALSMSLNRSELLILLDVVDHPDASLNDVCNRSGLKKSAASKIVEKLVQSAYIFRETCPTNRREIVLSANTQALGTDFCTTQITKQVFDQDMIQTLDINLVIESLKNIKKLIKKEK